MSASPTVAIVILNWNGRKFLEQFLPSVLATSYGAARVIVADNASTDDSLVFLSEHYPAVEQIVLDRNHGFARGYNLALEQVEADYFVLLNSDVEVESGWLEPMVELMEGNRQIAACQPKLLAWHDKGRFEYAGASGGWIDAWGYPFARGRIFEVCEEDQGQYDDAMPVFWASGAAMMIRVSAWRESGGLDGYFFAHQEEIDLCWRLQLAGYLVYAQPASVVYHVGGGTLPRGNSRKTYLNFRNNLIMLHKNLNWGEKIWRIPMRMVLDWVSAGKGLLGGDLGYFKAIIRAHGAFLVWRMRHRGESVFAVKRGGKLAGRWAGNLVWAAIVRGEKRFSKIVKKPV